MESVTKSSCPSSLNHNGKYLQRVLEIRVRELAWENGSESQWNWIISTVVNLSVASKAWENRNNDKATTNTRLESLALPRMFKEVCLTSPVPITYISAHPQHHTLSPKPLSKAPYTFFFADFSVTYSLHLHPFMQYLKRVHWFQTSWPSEKTILCMKCVLVSIAFHCLDLQLFLGIPPWVT